MAPEGGDFGTGWRGRLNRLVWRLVGPLLELVSGQRERVPGDRGILGELIGQDLQL